MKKVVGIGNSIVDVFVEGTEDELAELGLKKGSMNLVDLERWKACANKFPMIFTSPGGSMLNTLTTLAQLGLKCDLLSTLSKDSFGQTIMQHLTDLKIGFKDTPIFDNEPNARSLVIITPGGERTMVTHLGVATLLSASHISMHNLLESQMVIVEGYLVANEGSCAAMSRVMEICGVQNIPALLTLGSSNIVKAFHNEFKSLLHVGGDIIAGDLNEMNALYGTSTMLEVSNAAKNDGRLHIITNGAEGSVICDKNALVEVPPVPASKVTDTTGAGDQYLAGFLIAHMKGADHAAAGRFGSVLGSAICEQISANFHRDIKDVFTRATGK